MRLSKLLGVMAITAVAFGVGWYGREYRLLEGPRYVLTEPLELSASSNANGRIPAGVVLYHFRDLPEISTFVLFINTKRLDVLKLDQRDKDKSFLVVPVEVF